MACSGGVGPAEESVNPTPALTPDCRGPARRSRDGWQGKTRELEQEGKADGEAQGEEPQTHAGGQGRFCLARTGQGMLPVQTKAHASHLQAWERALQLKEVSTVGPTSICPRTRSTGSRPCAERAEVAGARAFVICPSGGVYHLPLDLATTPGIEEEVVALSLTSPNLPQGPN